MSLAARAIGFPGFTVSVCCENFGMPRVNALGRLLWRASRSQPDLKPEMRTSARARETVFLTQLTKETAKGSESGWEWGKG